MAFFDKGSYGSLSVTKDIWIYPATAIPFTLLVIYAWVRWRRRQIKYQSNLKNHLVTDGQFEGLANVTDSAVIKRVCHNSQVDQGSLSGTVVQSHAGGEVEDKPFEPINNITPRRGYRNLPEIMMEVC
jgi:hypothetical protein